MGRIGNAKKKLSDYVLEEIRRMLMEGELKEGDKLPNQNLFAKQLGVSRIPLREAIQSLQMMGVVEQKPGAGTIILSGNPQHWEQKPAAPMLSDSQATFELLETRRIVEIASMRLAVERITKEEIRSLRADIGKMKEALKEDDRRQYLKTDLSFHFHIAKASHNRYTIHMFLTIRSLMEQFMMEVFEVCPRLVVDSMDFHSLIFDELNKKNAAAAVRCLEEHLSSIETALRAYYEEVGIPL